MKRMAKHASPLIVCFALLFIGSTQAHVLPTDNEECTPYDPYNGAKRRTNMFNLTIQETDYLADKLQTIILPLHGSGLTFTTPYPPDQGIADTYGIQFYRDTTGYNVIAIDNEINRDGIDAEPNDDLDIIVLNFFCEYTQGTNTFVRLFTVNLLIDDANDNSPEFQDAPYSVSIKEALPITNKIFDKIKASDKDANQNKEIRFTIGSGQDYPPGNPVYEMPDSGLGEIYLFRALDYEALYDDGQTQFLLEIHARDNNVDAALRKTSTQTLTINVEDSDDLSPTFYYPNCRQVQGLANSCVVAAYSASITSGNTGVLTVVPLIDGTETTPGTIQAFDLDRLNAQINFVIEKTIPAGYENRFTIASWGPSAVTGLTGRDVYSAAVAQISPINRQDLRSFDIILRAEQVDDPTKYQTALIKTKVEANNVNDPEMYSNSCSFNAYIFGGNDIGETVRAISNAPSPVAFQIFVTDLDVTAGDDQSFIYEIVGNNVPFGIEPAGPNRVKIYATQSLDRETVPAYSFTVRVTENLQSGARSAEQVVQVTVLDVNDNDPQFPNGGQNFQGSILEGEHHHYHHHYHHYHHHQHHHHDDQQQERQ
ncbi:cadherin-99C-like [Mya arenaria]|uniref:cadherin-99C-like n=1 Tax=Mya arenaria TaxID=6604 RepID=UPI0022E76F1E|nr:cadherin-99C-like [Mya arenaria]XP_052814591.1 cadherin-99C-like [Mya arenaria]